MSKIARLRADGLPTIVRRRWGWYKARLQVNNPVVGRIVEMTGNIVRMDGLKFSVDSPNISIGHKSTLAFGLHEMEERALVKRWLPADVPAIELGGGLGVVSCLANRLLREPSRHVVVEANSYMIPMLERNRALNGCAFGVVHGAVAYGSETIEFPIDPEFVGSNIAAVGAQQSVETVRTTTLAKVADEAGFTNFSLISDIEGAESDLIIQEIPELGERVRFAMMEMHPYVLGDDRVHDLLERMTAAGFRLMERLGSGDVFSVAFARA